MDFNRTIQIALSGLYIDVHLYSFVYLFFSELFMQSQMYY